MSENEIKDISEIKTILDDMKCAISNLSLIMYKEIKIIKKMMLMKAKEIEFIFPEVAEFQIPIPQEPVLLMKDKYTIKCHRCGLESKSSGIVSIENDIRKLEFRCHNCAFIEYHEESKIDDSKV